MIRLDPGKTKFDKDFIALFDKDFIAFAFPDGRAFGGHDSWRAWPKNLQLVEKAHG